MSDLGRPIGGPNSSSARALRQRIPTPGLTPPEALAVAGSGADQGRSTLVATDEDLACPSCGRNPANWEGSCPHCPATDKELEAVEMNSYASGIDPWERQRKIRRALYNAGRAAKLGKGPAL